MLQVKDSWDVDSDEEIEERAKVEGLNCLLLLGCVSLNKII